jgi:hypothetical protein
METRTCRICGVNKLNTEFDKDSSRTDLLSSRCKECRRKYHNEYNDKNRHKKNESGKEYYYRTHEKQIKRSREKHEKNKQSEKEYRKNNRKKISKRLREKYNNDKRYSIEITVRNRLKLFLKTKDIKKKTKTFEIIGCTPDELRLHLEKKFKEGMTWDNYGFYGWHIDHIIPLSFGKTEEEIYKLSHYTNLQPLWCNENWEKTKKYE